MERQISKEWDLLRDTANILKTRIPSTRWEELIGILVEESFLPFKDDTWRQELGDSLIDDVVIMVLWERMDLLRNFLQAIQRIDPAVEEEIEKMWGDQLSIVDVTLEDDYKDEGFETSEDPEGPGPSHTNQDLPGFTRSERQTHQNWDWRERAFDILRMSREQINYLQDQLKYARAIAEERAHELEGKDALIEAMETKIKELYEIMEEQAKSISDQKKELYDISFLHQSLKKENKKLKERIEELEKENEALHEDKDRLKTGSRNLREELNKALQELNLNK